MSFGNFVGYVITILSLINHTFCIENIDNDHFKLYPYCGRLFGWESSDSKSRVVNSKDSLKYGLYPWVVYVERKRKNKLNKDELKFCGGTVIAYKYVIFIFQMFKTVF